MKVLRFFGSIAFVLGLVTTIFVGVPWGLNVSTDPIVPLWLKIAIYCILGGILLVMITVALEQKKYKITSRSIKKTGSSSILLSNSADIPGRKTTEYLGLVKGHTIFAIWLGKDLSALVRLVLGGELTEYTEMMGEARRLATDRMLAQAEELGADAVINLRYMTTSVIGSAAELLAYGTAVKLK
ncbi:YbjQ family protein [Candidatus Cloacimonadota bacterium]